MVSIIKKKRDGGKLSKKEIDFVVDGIISKEIPDYQLSAFLMAVYFKGLDGDETTFLTQAMMLSGDTIDLSSISGVKVDKHSTGGVGDKTTLVLAPLVAACGAPVAKMSGRGLGHTGGTLDKLQSIPGYEIIMEGQDFIDHVNKHHIAVVGQNEHLVPADKILYALRDVTATVKELSLIAASIMSKKLATGSDAIVIDVKLGKGAFMKTVAEAEKLGRMMINIGKNMGREVIVVVSDMNEPLGCAIGNALEVNEAIETLRGHGPDDLTDLCINLGSYMLKCAGIVKTKEEGITLLKEAISSGKALNKFEEWIQSQGGGIGFMNNGKGLYLSPEKFEVLSEKEGYLVSLDALTCGLASMKLGAGRATKDSIIDHGAGIVLNKKCGDYVKKGELMATLYAENGLMFEEVKSMILKDCAFSATKPKSRTMIYEVFTD